MILSIMSHVCRLACTPPHQHRMAAGRPLHCSHMAAQSLASRCERGRGAIVCVSSTAVMQGKPAAHSHCNSKAYPTKPRHPPVDAASTMTGHHHWCALACFMHESDIRGCWSAACPMRLHLRCRPCMVLYWSGSLMYIGACAGRVRPGHQTCARADRDPAHREVARSRRRW